MEILAGKQAFWSCSEAMRSRWQEIGRGIDLQLPSLVLLWMCLEGRPRQIVHCRITSAVSQKIERGRTVDVVIGNTCWPVEWTAFVTRAKEPRTKLFVGSHTHTCPEVFKTFIKKIMKPSPKY